MYRYIKRIHVPNKKSLHRFTSFTTPLLLCPSSRQALFHVSARPPGLLPGPPAPR